MILKIMNTLLKMAPPHPHTHTHISIGSIRNHVLYMALNENENVVLKVCVLESMYIFYTFYKQTAEKCNELFILKKELLATK